MTRKEEYAEYRRGNRWAVLRKGALSKSRYCALCSSAERLEVHHRRYPDVLGEEDPAWLTVLCHFCHSHFHNQPVVAIKKQKKKPKNKKVKNKKIKRNQVNKTAKRERITECPRCGGGVRVVKKDFHSRKFSNTQQYYYSEWDKCPECRYIQLYEHFKVMVTPEVMENIQAAKEKRIIENGGKLEQVEAVETKHILRKKLGSKLPERGVKGDRHERKRLRNLQTEAKGRVLAW